MSDILMSNQNCNVTGTEYGYLKTDRFTNYSVFTYNVILKYVYTYD